MLVRLPGAMLAEFVGSFFLTFIGIMAIHSAGLANTGQSGLLLVAVAHGLALAVAVTATMPTSGGHVNPAITIGFLITGQIKLVAAIGYVVAQLLGGCVAALAESGVLGGDAAAGQAILHGTPSVAAGVSPGVAMLAEIIATFLLAFVVWGTGADPRAKQVGGFAIGLTIAADIMAVGPISGASMNPQRTFGPAAIYSVLFGDSSVWTNHWVYWVGPILGACVAGAVYRVALWPRAEVRARDVPVTQRP
jgi:aquaporin TIP